MEIILYSTGCPKCQVLAKKLNDRKITYFVVSDVETIKALGVSAVPVLSVDGQLYNFSQANKWINDREAVIE